MDLTLDPLLTSHPSTVCSYLLTKFDWEKRSGSKKFRQLPYWSAILKSCILPDQLGLGQKGEIRSLLATLPMAQITVTSPDYFERHIFLLKKSIALNWGESSLSGQKTHSIWGWLTSDQVIWKTFELDLFPIKLGLQRDTLCFTLTTSDRWHGTKLFCSQ